MLFVVEPLSRVRLFVIPWNAACQGSLSLTIFWVCPSEFGHGSNLNAIDRWMDKEYVVCVCVLTCIYMHTHMCAHTHTHTRILLSHKKEWNMATCSNMDGPRHYHTKWSKPDRERQIIYDIIYMWNLRKNKWTYLQNRKRRTDIENKLCLPKGKGERRHKLGAWD